LKDGDIGESAVKRTGWSVERARIIASENNVDPIRAIADA